MKLNDILIVIVVVLKFSINILIICFYLLFEDFLL